MLRNYTPAPGFTLPDDNAQGQSLQDLHSGQPLVLLFFRGDFCPTSRRDLLNYADCYDRMRALGADMAAISADTPETLRHLRRQLGLPFPLLSDPDFGVSGQYGVYSSDDGEGPQPHPEPAVFVLDVDGKVVYSQVQTGPKGLAPPAEIVLMLIYMATNEGHYD